MSIPADHIKFSDDITTAWWVVPEMSDPRAFDVTDALNLDRPCDKCHGAGWVMVSSTTKQRGLENCEASLSCPACHGSGRHCFDIEVEPDDPENWTENWRHTLTVSVVPGMVLPIYHNDNAPMLDGARFVEMWDDMRAVAWIDGDYGGVFTLPSAAAVGMFAVRLNVHTPIGAGS